jgi:hypothetical protein
MREASLHFIMSIEKDGNSPLTLSLFIILLNACTYMLSTIVLTPKIGTGKILACEPNLAEGHHSAEGFPQSIR